jgi:tetratricopeptide (TPR) repeat protein
MTSKSRRQQIEEMLAEDPNDPFLRYGLAMEYASAGDLDAAVRSLQDLIAVAPDYVPAYLQAGQALTKLDREDEARAVYRAGIAVAVKKGDAHAAGEMEGLLDMIS